MENVWCGSLHVTATGNSKNSPPLSGKPKFEFDQKPGCRGGCRRIEKEPVRTNSKGRFSTRGWGVVSRLWGGSTRSRTLKSPRNKHAVSRILCKKRHALAGERWVRAQQTRARSPTHANPTPEVQKTFVLRVLPPYIDI